MADDIPHDVEHRSVPGTDGRGGFTGQLPDPDPVETAEWLDSLSAVAAARGPHRARYLLWRLLGAAPSVGVDGAGFVVTDYVNTIPAHAEPHFPGDEHLEWRIRRIIRWNAAVMVARANRRFDGIGGQLAAALPGVASHRVHRDAPR